MIERRKDKRLREENRVRIERPGAEASGDEVVINALTEDISLGGAKLITNSSLDKGSEFKMVLILSRTKKVIRVRATVQWVRQVDVGIFEMGVEFQHGIPASVLTLINHLYGKDRG